MLLPVLAVTVYFPPAVSPPPTKTKNERKYGVHNRQKVEKFRRSLREIKDISKFKSLDKSLVHEMDKVFSGDIPKLMEKAARPGNR